MTQAEKILFYKKKLPKFIWRLLRRQLWNNFWIAEEEQQRQLHQGVLPGPIRDTERAKLIEAILEQYPFRSLLEIGASYGTNFHTLGKLLPEVEFLGIDQDKMRIDAGNIQLQAAGLKHCKLDRCSAQSLARRFPENSYDLVISSACMLYIPPDDISLVLSNMLAIARQSVILLEQHLPGLSQDQRCEEQGRWPYFLRDYLAYFKTLTTAGKTTVFKVPNPIWPNEKWKEYGSVIVVSKKKA
ncbi:class I SAM-dependent methyltransferase [bacterium]|nr:class I SAM-dependent methyltransferase [bacterium]